MNLPIARNLWIRLFFPFAFGYFLSYLYRTVNAVIGPILAKELSLPDNALGLITSTYFLAFGAAQLPLGILLDHFGPRRVEATLLVVAAAGTATFSMADTLSGLAIGRAMIGLGVAACLMASFKAFSQWFPAEQQASLAGWVMAAGGLGALAASKPLEMALGIASWREIVQMLTLITVFSAACLWSIVPDKPIENKGEGFNDQLRGLRNILTSRHFWRYAPNGFFLTGGFMALQGLWGSRWMNVMENLTTTEIAARLTWMSISMLLGFLTLGFFSTRLVRRGITLEKVYLGSMSAGLLILSTITFYPQLAGDFLWPLFAACFSLSNISYSLVALAFPVALSGRANTALNLLVFAGAFGLQWGIGILVDALQSFGWTTAEAFRASFIVLSGGQLLALFWLIFSGRRP